MAPATISIFFSFVFCKVSSKIGGDNKHTTVIAAVGSSKRPKKMELKLNKPIYCKKNNTPLKFIKKM